uniref:Uncharacterized protein n=1 Tax=Anguilla anguilla TaxID=7936 RepID=A0A0E9UUY8_ANGAN
MAAMVFTQEFQLFGFLCFLSFSSLCKQYIWALFTTLVFLYSITVAVFSK